MGLPGAALHRALLLGAGGAGVAVAHAALKLGIGHLSIVDLDPRRATRLAADLTARFGAGRAFATEDVAAAMRSADGLIHATPTGMHRYPGNPLEPSLLQPHHWVAEIVYVPLVTPLLAQARQVGCSTLDGAGMAIYQAAAAFELFTGLAPDLARMRAHFSDLAAATTAAPAHPGESGRHRRKV
jgi:shikimate dehydrogenase